MRVRATCPVNRKTTLDCSAPDPETEIAVLDDTGPCDTQALFDRFLESVRSFWTPLYDRPEETPERLLCALWRTACGMPVSVDRAAREDLPTLDAAARARLQRLLARKKAGVPLAHLTGRQTFLGIEMVAGPQALIPRKETETLGRAALSKLQHLHEARGPLRIVDVCTGSGNLAIAYAHYLPDSHVYASDICPDAVALAQRNLEHVRANTSHCGYVEFRQGDLFEPFEQSFFVGQCDFLSCNPPYISSAKVKQLRPEIAQHEPEVAFNGGAFGVSVLTRLVKQAARLLKPGSWLGFEVGSGQGEAMARQLERNAAFSAVETCLDNEGVVRAVFARSAD